MSKINWQNIIKPELVAPLVAQPIIKALKNGQRVLWLVPGGSATAVAIKAADLIAKELRGSLIVTLTDERYGPVGHQDSSWQRLQTAGFNLIGAKSQPVLTGANFLSTVSQYNDFLAEELSRADYKIGLFGIGPDGHTAGILPHSPALISADLVAGYEAADFFRVTVTPRAIAKLDEIIVFATGAAKWPTLAKLPDEIDMAEQPAQALKQAAKLTIFTDY